MPQVTRTIEIRAAPSKVWRFLATQEGLRQWISPTLEIDLKLGGNYRFVGPDQQSRISGTVLEFVPEGWLILSWTEEGQGWEHPARLVVALEASGSGTKVTLIHDGFAGTGYHNWPDLVSDYERGADQHKILQKLAALVDECERRPD